MLKMRGIMSDEQKSECIRIRNEFLKNSKFSILDGGIGLFGDAIIVGEKHKDAADFLKNKLLSATNVHSALNHCNKAEDLYDVQVWDSSDFDIHEIID